MRLGTRASPLALVQANLVRDQLTLAGIGCDLTPITTEGDRTAGSTASDKGRWVKEIDDALLTKKIDLAVHSAKDIPGVLPEGIQISAVLPRANPHDGICFADSNHPYSSIHTLPPGSQIGTSSLRRAAQLYAQRNDLVVKPIRGNVGTRLQKLHAPERSFDAIVLALAGLERLQQPHRAHTLTVEEMVPAPGQGIIAITTRIDDETTHAALAAISDLKTATCLQIERSVAQGLEASCDTPLGVFAHYTTTTTLEVKTFFGAPDGSRWVRDQLTGDDPQELAKYAAQRIQQTYIQDAKFDELEKRS